MRKKPVIRFEGYTEDWQQLKVREVADRYDNLRIPVAANLRIPGSTPYYGANGIQDYVEGYTHEGEFILVAEDGANDLKNYPVKCVKGRIWVNNHAHVLQGKNEIADNKFLAFAISQADIESLLVGGGRAKLNAETLMEIDLLLPVKQEQMSIGNYFTNLDNLITLHQSNYEKMVATKKSMLDKLFPQGDAKVPAIRFEGFVGNWEKKPLGAIVIPYSDPVEVPHNGYERLGIRSHGKGVFHEYVEAGKEITTAQLHRVAAHNFIVNITFAWEHAVAVTCDSDAGKLVSHRFPQFSMADGIHDQFLKYLILDARFRHHLLLSSPGGAGRNRVLKIPEMLEYEMMIPDIEEQKQIASYLNSLDELIELYRIRIEKLKNIKAACLQGMFV